MDRGQRASFFLSSLIFEDACKDVRVSGFLRVSISGGSRASLQGLVQARVRWATLLMGWSDARSCLVRGPKECWTEVLTIVGPLIKAACSMAHACGCKNVLWNRLNLVALADSYAFYGLYSQVLAKISNHSAANLAARE